MKTVKYIGAGTGPAFSASRLSEAYDFSVSGVCDMADEDANLLLVSSGAFFKLLDASTVTLAATRAVTDATTAPLLATATVNAKTLVLTYAETTSLKSSSVPADYAVTKNGAANVVTKVSTGSHTITLYLTTAIVAGDVVTVTYDATTVYDQNNNAAIAKASQAVTNNTPA